MDLEDCKARLKDKRWRLNHLYWIKDEHGQKVRFRANEIQRELYNNQWYFEIILKSRQHGVTTYYCILRLDDALFTPNLAAGIIAHNRDDAQAFFKDKVKFAYDSIDPRIKPLIPTADTDSANMLRFDNGSSIRVGTSLRSGTLQRLHISEFGKVCAKFPDKAKEIVSGALNTVHVGQRISIESTAEGNSGYFYDYCMDAQKKAKLGTKLSQLDFKFFFFPWWKDPKNKLNPDGIQIPKESAEYFDELSAKHGITLTDWQKAWYVKKIETQRDLMKREHPSTPEEAFEASIEGAYFSKELAKVYAERRIRPISIEPGIPVDTYWDIGRDMMSIWFVQEIGSEYRFVDYYAEPGMSFKSCAKVIRDKGYKYGRFVGPHDIEVHELSDGVARIDKAAALGMYFETAPKLDKDEQIDAARDVFASCWFDEERVKDTGVRALENYRKIWNEKKQDWEDNPFHDWASHGADAFMIFAVMHKSNASVFQGIKRRAL